MKENLKYYVYTPSKAKMKNRKTYRFWFFKEPKKFPCFDDFGDLWIDKTSCIMTSSNEDRNWGYRLATKKEIQFLIKMVKLKKL